MAAAAKAAGWWDAPLPPAAAFGALCDAAAAAAPPAVAAGESSSTGGGRTLLACAAFRKGAVVLTERPVLLVQDPSNRASVKTCAFCHAFLRRPSAVDPAAGPEGVEAAASAECECTQGCGEGYCDARCR
jgi:hypothetical protein